MPNPSGKTFGFSKRHRLSSKRTIDGLFRKGEFRSRGYLKFRYRSTEEGYTRVVISISKRAGNSPQRNRIKRLIRESLRLSGHLHHRSIDCGIFITRAPQKPPTLAEIQGYIAWFFSHLPDESSTSVE
ncbi:MAG: ribonuclease P protein component [SAR324 cluster bacterium]|uniref:Ribonuclease P protein component n=1 Tax=SAR324 cluster bacterium TaxID=2024889 RepID=A0A2A4T4B8_9DELT|nr:MAG: ribonuclease P protein component [SAR324 cluster bacterium]